MTDRPQTDGRALGATGGDAPWVHVIEPTRGDDALLVLGARTRRVCAEPIEAIAGPTARERCQAAGLPVNRWHTATTAEYPLLAGMTRPPTVQASFGKSAETRICAWSPKALELAANLGTIRGRADTRASQLLGVGAVSIGTNSQIVWQSTDTLLPPSLLRPRTHASVLAVPGIEILARAQAARAVDDPQGRRSQVLDLLSMDASQRIVGLIDGDPRGPNARHFTQAVGITKIGGAEVSALVSEDARWIPRAARFVKGFRRVWDMVVHHGPSFALMPVWDIAVWLQSDPDDLATSGVPQVLAAVAHGIPIVTSDTAMARLILGSHPEISQLVATISPPTLGAELLALSTDAQRCRALAAAQRAHCMRALTDETAAGAISSLGTPAEALS